jgi:hypothetical protein
MERVLSHILVRNEETDKEEREDEDEGNTPAASKASVWVSISSISRARLTKSS